jgi:cell division protein FtsL
MSIIAVMLIICGLIGAVGVLVLINRERKLKEAEADAGRYKEAFNKTRVRATRLREALQEDKRIEECADAERRGLAETEDGGLVARANRLF